MRPVFRLASMSFLALSLCLAAHANPLQVDGTYAVTDTSSPSDKLTVTSSYPNGSTIDESLIVGQPVNFSKFVQLSMNDTATSTSTQTATIQVLFNFNDPTVDSVTLVATVTESVVHIFGSVYTSVGTVTWSGGNGGTTLLGTTEDLFFADGSEVALYLKDGIFGNLNRSNTDTLGATETLLFEPAPEPSSYLLLATGLLAIAFLVTRRPRAVPAY